MSVECQLESIRRVNFLRAELEHSLRVSGGGNSPTYNNEKNQRPLRILFRSGEAAQIQISGPPISDLRPRQAPSRFTVSPTPNAVPAMTDEQQEKSPKARPLRVLINTKPAGAEAGSAIAIPPPATVPAASSPASSVDSGVASPGANDFLMFGGTQSPPLPSWATVPRTKRRVFNFTAASLIEALTLPRQKCEQHMDINKPSLMLQKPPEGKKPQPNGSSPPCPQNDQTQQQQTKQSQSIQQSPQNGYSSTNSSVSSFSSSSSSSPKMTNSVGPAAQHQQPLLRVFEPMQRQLSEGATPSGCDLSDPVVGGLPPRAATMPPLKSILKKPKMATADHHLVESPLPRNHQRRLPTRFVLSRSISEGLPTAVDGNSPSTPPFDTAASFNDAILSKLASPTVLEAFDEHLEQAEAVKEEEAEQPGIRAISSPSSCSTETIESEESFAAAPIVKKRVSFSEHVQARIYRTNSSILGQRRKNEKKTKQRNRRSNSDEYCSNSDHDDGIDFGNSSKQTPPICRSRESASVIFSDHPMNSSGFSVLAQ